MTRQYLRRGDNAGNSNNQAMAEARRPLDASAEQSATERSGEARNRAPNPDREMEMLLERHARDGGTLTRMNRLKLAIPQAVMDAYPNWHFHWFLDKDARIHDMTVNDYYVPVDEVPPVIGGTNSLGHPEYLRLYRKPKVLYDKDRQAKDGRIKEGERGMIAGQREVSGEHLPGEVSYNPGGNSITTG